MDPVSKVLKVDGSLEILSTESLAKWAELANTSSEYERALERPWVRREFKQTLDSTNVDPNHTLNTTDGSGFSRMFNGDLMLLRTISNQHSYKPIINIYPALD